MAELIEKTCLNCGTSNMQDADACMVCGNTTFRPSATHGEHETEVIVVAVPVVVE